MTTPVDQPEVFTDQLNHASAPRGRYIGYDAVHGRLRRLYGRASLRPCEHCGGVAKDWAYDHTDPNELSESANGAFSLDLKRYFPLCSRCHLVFDQSFRRFGKW